MLDFKRVQRYTDAVGAVRDATGMLHSSAATMMDCMYQENYRHYQPQHFDIRELVPRREFDALGDKALILLDARIVWTADALWEVSQKECFVGAYPLPEKQKNRRVWCNTWMFGGQAQYRGYRPHDAAIGAVHSQHRYGRALDLHFDGIPAEVMRKWILANTGHAATRYISAIEDDVSWLHVDCRNSGNDEIVVFGA